MSGFDNDVVYADNVDFSGGSPVVGKITTDGQLLIGSTASPNIRVGTLASAGGTITVTNSAGGIDLAVNGSTVGKTITGNSGGALSPTAGNWNIVTSNTTVDFAGATSTLTQDFGISNLLIGSEGTGITVAATNVGVGANALVSVTSGSGNTAIGHSSADSLNTGSNNVAVGKNTLVSVTGSNQNTAIGVSALQDLTTSTGSNTAVGYASLNSIATGTRNVALGEGSGGNLTGSDSSNITIGNAGVIGDNNTIRIGTNGNGAGEQDTTFVAGITGVTVAASAPIAVDTNGQLSSLGFGTATQVLTSNGAGTSPSWQAAAAGGLTWNEETGASVNAVVSNGYITNAGGGVTVNLPATFAVGDTIRVLGKAGLWIIDAPAGDTIQIGDSATSSGGTLTATNSGDAVELIGITADTTWRVASMVGNITYA